MSGDKGPYGTEGWSGQDDVSAKEVVVRAILWEDGKRVEKQQRELLYVDRTNREVGLRLGNGNRVFIRLTDLLEILKRE